MKQGRVPFSFYIAALFLCSTPAVAGQVYGTVTGTGGPVSNASVRIECPGLKPAQRKTDQYGSYSVYVNGRGKCEIRVNGAGPLSIRVYDDEARYDLHIEGNSLKRK